MVSETTFCEKHLGFLTSLRRHGHDFRIPHGGLFAFMFGAVVVVQAFASALAVWLHFRRLYLTVIYHDVVKVAWVADSRFGGHCICKSNVRRIGICV